jgi:REP element-mobilizing transposase RayT
MGKILERIWPQHTFYLRPWNLCIKCRLINDIHFILNYSPKIQTLNLINLVEPVYIRLQFCNYLYFFIIIINNRSFFTIYFLSHAY